jgi:hypothetical protein
MARFVKLSYWEEIDRILQERPGVADALEEVITSTDEELDADSVVDARPDEAGTEPGG